MRPSRDSWPVRYLGVVFASVLVYLAPDIGRGRDAPSSAEWSDLVERRDTLGGQGALGEQKAFAEWTLVRTAVESGLAYLRGQQLASGAVGSQYPAAVTSLTGLAVLGAGYMPGPMRSPHDELLRGCLKYIVGRARQERRGFISEEGESSSRMHGHAYAVLFLCELLGALEPTEEAEVRGLIRSGIEVIEKAQTREGGWYYTTNPDPDQDEASVTVCALQALRAARNAGLSVSSATVDRAISYVKRCQQKTGAFAYSIREPSRTTYALSVAAMSTLNAAGVYDSAELRSGFHYLETRLGAVSSPWDAAETEFDYYANLYAAQVYFQRGGRLWDSWFPAVRDHLLKAQGTEGFWDCRFGNEYATAVAILILEVPLGYLPMFQR